MWVLDGDATKVLREIPTGMGAHGLYLSRDASQLYVTNRHDGSVSVLDAYTGAPLAKWMIPGGGSPDMGNVTADGTQLWLCGRYDRSVYVLSTADGHLAQDRCGKRASRALRLASAGPVLAGAHGHYAVGRRPPGGSGRLVTLIATVVAAEMNPLVRTFWNAGSEDAHWRTVR